MNLYYIDDDGYRIPAPPEVEERLLSISPAHKLEYDEEGCQKGKF